jgi:hypothetical protein
MYMKKNLFKRKKNVSENNKLFNQYPLYFLEENTFCITLYNYSLLLRSMRVFMDLKNDIHRSLEAEVNIDF